MPEEEYKYSKWKTYGYPLIALIVGVVAYYVITSGVLNEDILPDKDCLVTEEWFEEAFGQPIDPVGKNYEVRDGEICITNAVLLDEIYDFVR